QARPQGMRSRRLSHCTTGHKIAARSTAIVSGTKMESPSHSAIATPSNPKQFNPMRVADDRLRSITGSLETWPADLSSHLTGSKRIVQQHCDGHGSDAARYRRDCAG